MECCYNIMFTSSLSVPDKDYHKESLCGSRALPLYQSPSFLKSHNNKFAHSHLFIMTLNGFITEKHGCIAPLSRFKVCNIIRTWHVFIQLQLLYHVSTIVNKHCAPASQHTPALVHM